MIGTTHLSVRASVASDAALSLLKKHDIQKPPVPVKKIILQENWEFSYFYNSQYPEFANEEGFTLLKGGIYHIYVNAELPSGRDNFTYAHEIAHVVLRHHKNYEIKNLSDHENWILDREANIFAVNLLMTEEWIRNRIDKLPLSLADIGNLKNQFGVSWEAIINRLDELSIQPKSVTHGLFAERKLSLSKNDAVIEADENYRYLSCPECGSRDISSSASYCKICGMYLFNDCTNLGCGKHNAPDARYCEHCGAETILFQAGLLMAVRKENQAKDYGGNAEAGGKKKTTELRIIQNATAKKGGFGV